MKLLSVGCIILNYYDLLMEIEENKKKTRVYKKTYFRFHNSG